MGNMNKEVSDIFNGKEVVCSKRGDIEMMGKI